VKIPASDTIVEGIYTGKVKDLGKLAFFVNANNKGYCRARLDKASLEILTENVGFIEEPADRVYMWRTLADHVAQGYLPPQAFLESVLNHLKVERIELGL
jgi:hypothetical protein